MSQEITKYDPEAVFNSLYMTAGDICREMGVSRTTLKLHRDAGHLPGAFSILEGRVYIWERRQITPYLDAWKRMRQSRNALSEMKAASK